MAEKKTVLDLGHAELSWFGMVLFRVLGIRDIERPDLDDDSVYRWILEQFFLDCHHPLHRRKYFNATDFECGICRTVVCVDRSGGE